VLVTELQTVDDAQQFGEVTACRRRISKGETNRAGGIDWRMSATGEESATFVDSLINTVLTVKGMPFLSTLVLSSPSSMPYSSETLRSSSAMMGRSTSGPLGWRPLMSLIQPA
jgi:hypothetical protein